MIRFDLDMDMPEECHECPFQLKFKDGEVDAWYMRRCVIMQRKIEYPRPEWCPLKEQQEIVRCKDCVNYKIRPEFKNEKYALGRCDNISYLVGPYWFCADGKRL